MLVGIKCMVGSDFNKDNVDYSSYKGTIVSDPSMNPEGDFYVLVLKDGELKRVDTDLIHGLEM